MRLRSERILEEKIKASLREFGYTGEKATIVCNCESPAEANKMAERAGLGSKWFLPDCCEEIKDDDGVDLFPDTDMAICVDGKNFLKVDDIRDFLLR